MLAIFYGSILLLMLPDNGAVDTSAGEDLGHVTEQPQDESGQLRLIHNCRAPGHQGPLELRHLAKIMILLIDDDNSHGCQYLVQQPPALHALSPDLALSSSV